MAVGVQLAGAGEVGPLQLGDINGKTPRKAEAVEVIHAVFSRFVRRRPTGAGVGGETGYIEYELPQPHCFLAFGLIRRKPRALRSEWKSTVVPEM